MRILFKTDGTGVVTQTITVVSDDEQKRVDELIAKGFIDATGMAIPKTLQTFNAITKAFIDPVSVPTVLDTLTAKASALWTIADVADWLKARR